MPLYETVLIARNDVTQQQVEAVAEEIKTDLETEGGAVKKTEYWGLRSLAYRIKKNRKGHYMLLSLDAKPAFITEMERKLGLNEDILRFMTIRVEEVEEGPSAILSRKSDERERSFRGPKPAGRFESGRRRGFDDREEFRARDEFLPRDELRPGVEEEAECPTQTTSIPPPAAPLPARAARSIAAASPARSQARTRRRSTTRTCACCPASFRSAARSCRAGSRLFRRRSSGSWRRQSSA